MLGVKYGGVNLSRRRSEAFGLKPTKVQEEVLAAFQGHFQRHGLPPSVRQLCDATGRSSSATIFDHLQGLVDRGILRKVGHGKYLLNSATPSELLAAFVAKFPDDELSIQAREVLGGR